MVGFDSGLSASQKSVVLSDSRTSRHDRWKGSGVKALRFCFA